MTTSKALPASNVRVLPRIAAVALASIVGAFVLAHLQHHPLGDEPLAMLMFGGVLAVVAGALLFGVPRLAGLLAMSGFPVWAAVDLARHGGHSLVPFEFGLYAVYGLIGVGLALLGRSLRLRAKPAG